MKIKLNRTLSKPLPQLMKAQVGGVDVDAQLARSQSATRYKALPQGIWRTEWVVTFDAPLGAGSVVRLIYPSYY